MLEFAKLELRKSRLLAGGLASAFLITLPIAAGVGPLVELSAAQSVHAVLSFWTVLGVALMAAFLGATAGSELRTGPFRAMEALLPVSPRQRAAAGGAAAAAQTAALAALVFGAAAAFSPEWRGDFAAFILGADPMLLRLALLCAWTAGAALLSAFACAYLCGQSLLGGLLGCLLTALAVFGLAVGCWLEAIFKFRAPFTALGGLTALAGLLASALALYLTVPGIERRSRASRLAAAALLLWGPLSALGAAAGTQWRLRQSLLLISGGPEREGVVAETVQGLLVWIRSDGARKELVPALRPESFFGDLVPAYFAEAKWDKDGSLVVLRSMPGGKTELLRGDPAKGLAPVALLRDRDLHLWTRDKRIRLSRIPDEHAVWLSDLPEGGRSPDWKPWKRPRRKPFEGVVGPEPPPPQIVHEAEGFRWQVVDDRRLLKLDAAGRQAAAWELPDLRLMRDEGRTHMLGGRDGLFLHDGRRLWFMDWNGRLRDLGRA